MKTSPRPKLTWMLALIIAFVAARAPAADPTDGKKYDFAAVTKYCEAAVANAKLSGAGLLVYKDGRVIYDRFFGEYDDSTVVPIASASKWLSGAVIMSLVDEGKIDLAAPLSKYLPNFMGKLGTITIRQAFSHTSGLVDLPGAWPYEITMAEYADRIAKDPQWGADPGKEIRYASCSMQLVGCVAEAVTGKRWNDLFKERIGGPCDMPNTAYARVDENKNPLLAGGAFSTMHDYAHFLEMLINDGEYRGRRVLSAKAVREMQKDQTNGAPLVRASNDRMGRKSRYGIGEWVDEQDAQGNTLQVSSPGAFGFRPWINLPRKTFGVWMVQHPRGGNQEIVKIYDAWDIIAQVHKAIDEAKP